MKIGSYKSPGPNTGLWTRDMLAWAAGAMDGEGCTHNSSSQRRGQLLLQVAQSSDVGEPEMLIKLRNMFGGVIYSITIRPSSVRKRPFFQWRISGEERVQATIAAMWPWLGHEKRVQATAAITSWRQRWG